MGVAVLVWAGVLAGGRLGATAGLIALLGAAALAALAWRALPRTGALLAALALLLAAGARGAGHQAVLECARARLGQGGAFHRVEARLAEPPPREAGEPMAVLEVRCARPPLVAGSRLRVRLPAGSTAEWGDVADAVVRLEPPRPCRNPGGFDGRAAADAAAVVATGRAFWLRVRAPRLPEGWPRLLVARWRRSIEKRLDCGLSPAARELAVPLLTGDRSGLSSGLYADLRAAGLIHLLALSGLHVVWAASVARALVASLGGAVVARALAAAGCALIYAGIAGPLPSLMRAAVHECLMAVASLRGRALDPLQALALAAVGLLAWAPGWARDLGFQLSCAATLGLVTLGPWLRERAGSAQRWCAPFIPTTSAQATALPLLLGCFHAVSWVGLLANLVAVPVAGLLLVAAWLGALTELALPGLGRVWFSAAEVLAAALRGTAGLAARAPQALLAAGSEPGVAGCAAVGVTLLMVGLPRARTLEGRRRTDAPARVAAAWLGALLLGAALLGAVTARPLAPPPGRAWLVALDVGQGDALALAFGRTWWLLDAGPRAPGYDAGESVVLPFFRWAGVRRLEWLLLTHDDADHAGAAGAVLRGMAVGRVGLPPPHDPGRLATGGRVRRLGRGDLLCADPPARVLWPPRTLRDSDNRTSLVLELGEGRGRLLLAADVDSVTEDSLELRGGAALLKVAHHGAAAASGSRFLDRLRPRLAVLSVGARNRFGHPAPEVLARLAAVGTRVRRTDVEGALWFECSAAGLREVAWRHGEPRRPPPTASAPPPAWGAPFRRRR